MPALFSPTIRARGLPADTRFARSVGRLPHLSFRRSMKKDCGRRASRARHKKAGQPGLGTRKVKKASLIGAEQNHLFQRASYSSRPGAPPVRNWPKVRAALPLGHRHADCDGAFLREGQRARIVVACKELRLPLLRASRCGAVPAPRRRTWLPGRRRHFAHWFHR